ncbi:MULTISPECIES: flagellar hook-length control protein FliK [unclassified Halomonas]|uniref:flagellar hook-length control protein FliK n=1 Tax=unclassified Halomonas TaxID=2609666 RepID=UPI001C974E72|nr:MULTISPECIES: flagellar hook-length control protein FliK [unclassified Halomonas]MBY5926548.1 flagellar hook-length control protein FliK [Halomonas sp. DP4Y7-2]MBY6233739.1 flagellar hook-length control protein FliK [Halomonas sp. DP4Y7-1]
MDLTLLGLAGPSTTNVAQASSATDGQASSGGDFAEHLAAVAGLASSTTQPGVQGSHSGDRGGSAASKDGDQNMAGELVAAHHPDAALPGLSMAPIAIHGEGMPASGELAMAIARASAIQAHTVTATTASTGQGAGLSRADVTSAAQLTAGQASLGSHAAGPLTPTLTGPSLASAAQGAGAMPSLAGGKLNAVTVHQASSEGVMGGASDRAMATSVDPLALHLTPRGEHPTQATTSAAQPSSPLASAPPAPVSDAAQPPAPTTLASGMLQGASEAADQPRSESSLEARAATDGLAAPASLNSRGAAPLAASPLPATAAALSLNHNAWPQQLGHTLARLSSQAGDAEQKIELRLHPAELGSLGVTLKLGEHGAQAQFFSAHAQVRQTLEQAIPQLREALAEQGIQLGDASVSDQGTHPGSQGNAQDSAAGGGQAALASAPSTDTGLQEATSRQAPSLPLGEGRVDLYA